MAARSSFVLMGNHAHLPISSGETGRYRWPCAKSARPTSPPSTVAIGAAERCRKDASSPAWSTRVATCLPRTAISNSTRFEPPWSSGLTITTGPSSVHANLALCEDALVTPHACFLELGATALTRAEAYRTWLSQGVSDDELTAIRQHLQQERALGSKRFQAMAERTLGRPVSVRRPGRPGQDQDKPEVI